MAINKGNSLIRCILCDRNLDIVMTLNLKNDKVIKIATQLRVQTYDNLYIFIVRIKAIY